MKTIVQRLIIVCMSIIFISLIFTYFVEARVDPETAVGVWLFDKPKVDTVEDISGKGNDGIVKSPPKWIDGKFGKAVEFAGSGQKIEVPDSDSLNFGQESFSVVVWFNFKASPNWSRLVRERTPSPWGSGNLGWELQTQGVQIHWSLDDKAGHHKRTTYANAGNGEWRHTAMIVNRDKKKLITYLDGGDEKSVDIADIESVTGILPVVIGGGVTGAIDEVGIFNVVLTVDDVVDVMKLGLSEVLGGAAVSPFAKLATTWGRMKSNK
ncbi:MAG: LamG-like jellyroll fold domain-containing protein [Candidatus Poribacteria bacterium]